LVGMGGLLQGEVLAVFTGGVGCSRKGVG
jgi:hypothetical protein